MYKNARRILEAMHAGHILCEDNGLGVRESRYYLKTWYFELLGDETNAGLELLINADTSPEKNKRPFTQDRRDDLYGLVEDLLGYGANARSCLTPSGLAAAQDLFGPITVPLPVVESGPVYLVVPNGERVSLPGLFVSDTYSAPERIASPAEIAALRAVVPQAFSAA